jgi:hypothetical protein
MRPSFARIATDPELSPALLVISAEAGLRPVASVARLPMTGHMVSSLPFHFSPNSLSHRYCSLAWSVSPEPSGSLHFLRLFFFRPLVAPARTTSPYPPLPSDFRSQQPSLAPSYLHCHFRCSDCIWPRRCIQSALSVMLKVWTSGKPSQLQSARLVAAVTVGSFSLGRFARHGSEDFTLGVYRDALP